ncbi:hypothetical protein ACE193_16890 [Bernardetia sp. OM2101]|uniref:hypothetical protein n=1 Tax=Bernardetia sp. OM2101 TaxID=3344876 RepID=UPI0035D08A4B
MKKYHFLLFIPFGLFCLYILSILILNIDYSRESFERDHYKWKIEGMKEFSCLCDLFENNQFSGTVVLYKNPLGAGENDIISIKIDSLSDSAFIKDVEIQNFLGVSNYLIKDNNLVLKVGPNQGPQNLKKGDKVSKSRKERLISFKGNYGVKTFDPYYRFEDIFINCTNLDTMDVLYNLQQHIKYDKLSRVSHPIDYRTVEYMADKIEEQNKK